MLNDDDYSIPERTALLALMFAINAIRNPDLEERFGVDVDKKVRERLLARRLIVVHPPDRRANVLELTDEGWKWCRRELGQPIPAGAGKAYRLLYGVLNHVDNYLKTTDSDQAFFTGPSTVDRIRVAYSRLVSEPEGFVILTRLRAALSDIARPKLDNALLEMDLKPDVFLVPEANQKALKPADRMSAINIGGEDKHHLKIARQ